MNLSILIISYKSLKNLENCLQNLGTAREIVIVENSNDHELKNIIESKYSHCKVILNNKN